MSAVVDIAAATHRPPSLTMFSSAVVHHCHLTLFVVTAVALSVFLGDNDEDENEDDEGDEDNTDHPPPTQGSPTIILWLW